MVDAELAHRVGDRVHRLLHLNAPDRADAADAKGLDQHTYMEKTGQWRFTPPTHVVAALAEALRQFVEEGGQAARLARYTDNCLTLIDGMAALGFRPFIEPALQAPIIVSFHAPAHKAYEFRPFYEAAKKRGESPGVASKPTTGLESLIVVPSVGDGFAGAAAAARF